MLQEDQGMKDDDPVTVAVDGHLDRTTLPALEALDVLWQTVRRLPVSAYELQAMEWLLGSGSTGDLERMMDGSGVVDWPLGLDGGGQAIVRVWHGDGLTRAQRVGARYTAEPLPPGPRGGRSWAVRDAETGALVQDDEGTLRRFSMESGAQEWIQRQGYIAGYRGLPGREVAR
ncbi:hypothetical protein ACIRVF_08450 [Kitasatospora sp. NPDC101157]|uniref:hypothetical protein n=1 Tax=Kitasatospora sp. NPDC101157 TaxID=3364098 RepID=UPI0037F6F7BC